MSTDLDRYRRGDTALAGVMRLGMLTVVVITGTAAGLATLGTWPHLPTGLRILAGIGAACATVWLLVTPIAGGTR